MKTIPLTQPWFDAEEERAIGQTLSSGWVAGRGPRGEEFGSIFARFIGAKYAHPVSNCTAALHVALLASGITQGDEVIVPDFTFPATAHAVSFTGAVPRFVDIDLATFNIDPRQIEEKITNKTKAIIPVHLFGLSAEMDPLLRIAKKHSLAVIEDAACAAGATYKGRHVGTFGTFGCFSFHARKNATTGEGGMVVSNDKILLERAAMLSYFGITQSSYDVQKAAGFTIPSVTAIGYNYKLSDIQAAIGIVQLKKLPGMLQERRRLAAYYAKQLDGIEGIQIPTEPIHCEHIYQSYVCLLDATIDRATVSARLKQAGIQTQFGTYSCLSQPVYADSKDQGTCPSARAAFERTLALPFFVGMTHIQVDTVVTTLKKSLQVD